MKKHFTEEDIQMSNELIKIIRTISHQRNANQHNEILLYTYHNDF
jgi:hypothetical protein